MKCGVSSMPVQSSQAVGMLRRTLQAQQQEGQAALTLIASSTPQPAVGAPEPGKGQLLDVRA